MAHVRLHVHLAGGAISLEVAGRIRSTAEQGWGAYWSSGYMGEVSEDSCDIIITIAELKDITGSMTVGNEMLLEWAGAG